MPGSARLYFATSNDHKFEEARYVLRGLGISLGRLSSKGREIQADEPSEIASHAAAAAFAASGKQLIVEDTALKVASLGGFPGSNASYAFRTIGVGGILTLLGGSTARGAEFVSAVAYCYGRGPPLVFIGRLSGRIALVPAGSRGFGFDPIFKPSGSRKTLAEMSLEEKCALSHRADALRLFGAWFNKRPRRQPL